MRVWPGQLVSNAVINRVIALACAVAPLAFSASLPPHSMPPAAPLSEPLAVPGAPSPPLVLVLSSLPQADIMPVSATAAAAATHILVRVLLRITSLAFWVGCATAQITAIGGDTENLGLHSGRPLDLS